MDHDKALKAALERYQRDPDGYWSQCYADAQHGDNASAREMLECFANTATGGNIPAPILEYLGVAFSAYLSGAADLEKALLLTKPKGRPRGPGRDPVSSVAYMYLLVKRNGLSKSQAEQKACDDLHTDLRQLQRYDRENNAIRDLPLADLEWMARPAARAPGRRVKHRKPRSPRK